MRFLLARGFSSDVVQNTVPKCLPPDADAE
jgi:hypothetical protein